MSLIWTKNKIINRYLGILRFSSEIWQMCNFLYGRKYKKCVNLKTESFEKCSWEFMLAEVLSLCFHQFMSILIRIFELIFRKLKNFKYVL